MAFLFLSSVNLKKITLRGFAACIIIQISLCLIYCNVNILHLILFQYQKADDKIFVCKFSKNVKTKLYHDENSKTRGQTV